MRVLPVEAGELAVADAAAVEAAVVLGAVHQVLGDLACSRMVNGHH